MKYVIINSYNEIGYFEVLEENEETIKCKLTNVKDGWIVLPKKDILQKGDTIDELIEFYIGMYDCGAKEIIDDTWNELLKDQWGDCPLDEYLEDFENIYGVAMIQLPNGTPIFKTIAKVNRKFKTLELI